MNTMQNKPIQADYPMFFNEPDEQLLMINSPVTMSEAELAHVIDSISEDDKVWFASHPEEEFRVRDYVPGELHDYTPSPRCRILVQRLAHDQTVLCAIPPEIWQGLEDQHV